MRVLLTITAALALSASLGLSQEAATKIKKVPATYTNPTSGPEMYRNYCAACHGLDGKGSGPAAAALKKAPADLTTLSKKHGGKFPTLEVQQYIKGESITDAHGSRDMPMWGDLFRSIGTGNPDMVVTLRVKNLTTYLTEMQAK